MANVLDYLLPQSFMSDVQTVFKPKEYDISRSEFGKGLYGETTNPLYDRFTRLQEQGYEPTSEMAKMLMMEEGGRFEKINQYTFLDTETNQELSQNEVAQIIDQMINTESGMFVNKDVPAPNLFSGESMAQGFERAGLSDYDPAMTKPLKLSSLRNLDAGSYTGELESKRATLAQGLQSNLTQASQIGSGFAGYGQRNIASNLAQNQYSQGIEGVYQGINQQRATALQGLYSSLDDMRGLISDNNG